MALAAREELIPPHGLTFGVRHGYGPDFTGLGASEIKAWEAVRGPDFTRDPGRYLSLGAITAVVSTDNTNPLETEEPQARFPGSLSTPTRIDVWNRVSRAGLALRVRPVPSLSAAMAEVAAPDFEAGADVALVEASGKGLEVLGGGEVRVLRDENDTVEIESVASGPGLLVLRDTLREGWVASVDDRPEPILRADVLFRGVRVPAGRSTVRFRYETPGLRLAVGLCAAGFLILIAFPRAEAA
jgi:hypothetical protein